MHELAPVAAQFQLAGQVRELQTIAAGHINDTYLVATDQGTHYVLQRINHQVFRDPPALMRNVLDVTNHIHEKLATAGQPDSERRVLRVIETQAGQPIHETPGGEFWRMYRYVEGSHTVPTDSSLDEIYQAAVGFGQFAAQLVDFPASRLAETIPRFHHGPSRFAAFERAVEDNKAARVKECADEIEAVQQYQWLLVAPQQRIDSGELPLRVTHNDTKVNNLLLDDLTNEALCVIDLDTVMPGLLMWDFGDLVRTSSCTATEDETDLALVQVQPARLEQAARGYLAGLGEGMSSRELESLALGPSYMAIIMATRFLTDYLEGDTYYKTRYPQHNGDRCRNQLALLAELEQHRHWLESFLVEST